MGSAMTIGLLMGGLSAASSLASRQGQAAQLEAQADAVKGQAARAQVQGEVEAREIERRKVQMRREYEATQARNRVQLGAGNVDMTSGSAAGIAQGNIASFANDIGENAYSKALKEWETKVNVNTLKAQEEGYRRQAERQQEALPSILDAAISGASGFASGYSMVGGSLANLFGGKQSATALATQKATPVSRLTVKVPGGTLWGHPSGKGSILPGK